MQDQQSRLQPSEPRMDWDGVELRDTGIDCRCGHTFWSAKHVNGDEVFFFHGKSTRGPSLVIKEELLARAVAGKGKSVERRLKEFGAGFHDYAESKAAAGVLYRIARGNLRP